MRKQLATAALLLAATLGTQAQQKPSLAPKDKTQSSPRLNPVQERAKRLSDQMVRDLRLNGYQATRLRAINDDKVAKMAAIERKNAGNQKLIDEQCQGVCKERDQELQAVLSNDQYTDYYGSRSAFYKFDKDYASRSANANATFVNSVQNPSPASSGAVIAPARTTPAQTR
ncbi:hypothetical protein KBK19_08370 [Microvirga sp. STR05]|uniref:Uncharacterized protein n=1 Tax=Hymenobacter duratus TaxID=2771356 RepID=A0ABR8JH32_9BACT|nr:hypothetical protein [Hymenobacter duratus]MBD2715046.1 hypothetical protein [Hymenobacter duratus]MBR7949952.1 hypothetical protein [Microvirga sp. STR05]